MLDRNFLNIFDRSILAAGAIMNVVAIVMLALETTGVSLGTFLLLWFGPWLVGHSMGALAERKACHRENSDATN